MKYYIAYGSNLNVAQMKIRCPQAKVAGTTELNNYRLMFRGSQTGSYLTIEPYDGGAVPVAVWEVSDSDERALDRYEGYPRFYYKKHLSVTVDGRSITAFVYIMHEDRPYGSPSRYYVEVCEEGYDTFGFDKAVLHEAIRQSRRCPICHQPIIGYPALSRTDNRTEICADCGTRQALSVFREATK